MNFASDNTAGVAPAILEALAAANTGYARGYDHRHRLELRADRCF